MKRAAIILAMFVVSIAAVRSASADFESNALGFAYKDSSPFVDILSLAIDLEHARCLAASLERNPVMNRRTASDLCLPRDAREIYRLGSVILAFADIHSEMKRCSAIHRRGCTPKAAFLELYQPLYEILVPRRGF